MIGPHMSSIAAFTPSEFVSNKIEKAGVKTPSEFLNHR